MSTKAVIFVFPLMSLLLFALQGNTCSRLGPLHSTRLTFVVSSQLCFIMLILFSFQISEYAGHNDALLIVVIPAMQAADVASSRALRLAKDIDPDGLPL